jgi:predicted RNA-binding Zn-ribbon protein involved in translation (DUF1610 family)
MSESSEKQSLRFGCPACGVRLVVDQSIAGTEGPCPSCGARIIAPPVEVTRTLSEKQAAPVAIKPRGVSTATIPHGFEPSVVGGKQEASLLGSNADPMKKPVRRKRSVDPTSALSQAHQEKNNLKIFLKMLLAVLVVVAIAVAVYYYLIQAR